LTQTRGSQNEASILRLAPFTSGLDRSSDVPLRFVELHGRPHVLYSAANLPAWISWATEALVRWQIGNETFVGNATAVNDRETLEGEILPQVTRQFGSERLFRWFGSDIGCLALSGSPATASYYEQVEALFDHAAPHYDRTVQNDRLNLHLRVVSSEILRNLFPPGSRVLELGCGTGLETIPLAEAGAQIVAVDISAKMLAELDRKARAASVRDRVETRKGSIRELQRTLSDFGPGAFDGAFSHFGALNCEPNLDGLPSTLHQLIKAKGKVSLGVLNRTSLVEMMLFTASLRPSRAFARLRSTLAVGRSQFGVQVFPYGPGAIRRLFRPFFAEEEAIGVSVLLPPSHLGGRLLPHPTLLALLESIDASVADRPLFRFLGDYFLMQMVRR